MITKPYESRTNSSNELTPIQASLKKEGISKFLDKRKKRKPKFKIHDLFRTPDIKKHSQGEKKRNWSYTFCIIAENFKDTKPNYRPDVLPGKYKEASLKNAKSTLKENK